MNLQEVAGGKKFLELLLEAVNFTAYRLIRRTLHYLMPPPRHSSSLDATCGLSTDSFEFTSNIALIAVSDNCFAFSLRNC